MTNKSCSKCRLVKTPDCFYVSKVHKDGYRSRCKDCDKSSAIEWNKSNKDKVAKSSLNYYHNHKDTLLLKMKEYNKKWYLGNKNKKLEQGRQWASSHKKELCEYMKERVRNDPKEQLRRKAYGLEWFRSNPDKRKSYNLKRRAAKLGNGGSFTAQEWVDLKEFYGNKCLNCESTDRKLTADHVIPLKRGGSNYISNIQPLCTSCNSKKGTRIIDYRLGE